MENKKALVWLRDDFRINRNNALVYASENHEQVSTIYIFNPEEYENKREAQRWWIYHSLINFKQELSKFNISLELLVGDEIKVLSKMLESPGKVFSREDIGKIINISKERTIDVMITRLRQKIETNPKNPKYLQTIRGAGYVLWIE